MLAPSLMESLLTDHLILFLPNKERDDQWWQCMYRTRSIVVTVILLLDNVSKFVLLVQVLGWYLH